MFRFNNVFKALAQRPTPNPPSDFEWRVDEEIGGVAITKFLNWNASAVVVPDEIDGRPVVKIGESAFAETWLTSIKFPDGLRSVGSNAFYASCLTSLKHPNGLRSVDEAAFLNCSQLKSVELPDGLQTLERNAFGDYGSLTEFKVSPNSERFKLVDGVLFSKDGKTLIAYFEKMLKDGDKAIYVVPNGVETIQNGAFCGVESLTSVAFPDGLQRIGDAAFLGCESLTSVALPNGLQTVGKSAFERCSSLTSVAFPSGLQTLGESAFWECASLTSAVFPESLLTVCADAFYGCSDNLTLYGAVGSVAKKYARKTSFASNRVNAKRRRTPSKVTTRRFLRARNAKKRRRNAAFLAFNGCLSTR